MSNPRTAIIGAGVAGLACARDLALAGRAPVVFERSRGVGGRCATRRVEGRPVDHGVVFLHGSDPAFLAAVRSVESSTLVEGWPQRVRGSGAPCQPDAFAPGETRLAIAGGVSAFPKRLAEGVDVRLNTGVTLVEARDGGLVVTSDEGTRQVEDLVIALPAEQALRIIEPLSIASREVAAACRLLASVAGLPCLTLLAGYPPDAPAPEWDVYYPESSAVLQLVSHDTGKRDPSHGVVLVLQARPGWSRARLDQPAASWTREMLEEAAACIGAWAARPAWTQAHRWRFARADGGSDLASPMLLRLSGGGRVGLAGEIFARGGGVEAAWTSGRGLARRLLEEDE